MDKLSNAHLTNNKYVGSTNLQCSVPICVHYTVILQSFVISTCFPICRTVFLLCSFVPSCGAFWARINIFYRDCRIWTLFCCTRQCVLQENLSNIQQWQIYSQHIYINLVINQWYTQATKFCHTCLNVLNKTYWKCKSVNLYSLTWII